jgi:hypothetical protein
VKAFTIALTVVFVAFVILISLNRASEPSPTQIAGAVSSAPRNPAKPTDRSTPSVTRFSVPKTHSVLYKVTTGDYGCQAIEATFEMEHGSAQRTVGICHHAKTAEVATRTAQSGDFLYLSVQNDDTHSPIICEIYVDGVLLFQTQSFGKYKIASCSGRVPSSSTLGAPWAKPVWHSTIAANISELEASSRSTSVPTPLPTPLPTVALPTVTPTPLPDPDGLFLEWLTAHHYEFVVDVRDGSKRYEAPGSEMVIDLDPDSVLAWNMAFDGTEEATTLLRATDAMIGVIEAHGLDAEPIRAALAAPYQFPLTLQLPGYIFMLENEDHELYKTIRARVTFPG